MEVSAERLLAGLQREGAPRARREFPNTPEGHEALVRWLVGPGRTVRVVMEATGLYGLDLALRLDAAPGVEVMVANPRAVRDFAIALMKRSKNDPIDTDVLVEFAQRMPFQRWVRPSAAALALHALARRLESLTEMHAAEKNRLHAGQLSPALPAAVVRDLQRSLRGLERALARLTRQAVEVIRQEAELNLRYQTAAQRLRHRPHQQRKVSCTFKREIPLEIQKRIYRISPIFPKLGLGSVFQKPVDPSVLGFPNRCSRPWRRGASVRILPRPIPGRCHRARGEDFRRKSLPAQQTTIID